MSGRAAVWLALVLAACGGSSKPPEPTPPRARLTPQVARDLTAALHLKTKQSGVPGASAAVVFPDGREWSGAAGVAMLRPRTPMTTRTTIVFDSVTKMATAALALRLQEEGRLRLDDPVRRWYPAWRGNPKATVRQLLGHVAGTRDQPQEWWEDHFRHLHRVTLRAFIAASEKPTAPGDDVQYSNTGFAIVGLILQRAAGEPVATAMRHELFDHPGGAGLAMQPDETPHAPRAHSYFYPNGLGKPTDVSDGGPLLPSADWARLAWTAGALAGDVPSLARWGTELLSGRILRPESLKQMTTFISGGPWEAYGLGLALDSFVQRPMWGHTGDGLGSHTELWYFPRQHVTVAVSWNDDLIDRDGGILNALLDAARLPL
jgi:D-alanyl-D-alanine carboxypeptidase